MTSNIKYEVQLRLKTIELLALWEGRVVTNHLQNYFGVGRQQASKDINTYNTEINPNALAYERSARGYVPASNFKPKLSVGHINEYMELLTGQVSQAGTVALEPNTQVTAVRLPQRAVRPGVVRVLITAARRQTAIRLRYASMNQPEGIKRAISPHTLVYTGSRWHVRAYCHQNEDFRDFVISRILDTPVFIELNPIDPSDDSDWQRVVNIILKPNPGLSVAQQHLIAQDFAMQNNELNLKVRAALVQYTVDRYGAAYTDSDIASELSNPLIVSNREALKSWLFKY